jgi:small toxic polypeptide LdrA/B/C/D
VTYWLINLPFLLVAAGFTGWGALRAGGPGLPGRRRFWGVWGGTTAALLVLTAVFDNLMIASGLFTYSEENISGVRLGLMPVEDFTYSLAAAWILVPLTVVGPGRSGPAGGSGEPGPASRGDGGRGPRERRAGARGPASRGRGERGPGARRAEAAAPDRTERGRA